MAIEAEDNQLDFSILRITERKEGQWNYQIRQVNELLCRLVRYDPIQQFDYVINNGRMFGVSRRRSKNIDLYRDLMKVETPI